MTRTPIVRRLSRRDFLRATAAGVVGLAGAQLLGCSDGDGPPSPTATAPVPPTATGGPTAGALGWRQLAPAGTLPPSRRDHSLVADGERLYLFGGRSGGEPLGDVWVYDMAGNDWAEINAPGPAARFGHNGVWAPGHRPEDGRMLVFGGQAADGTFFNDAWVYDPATNTWEQVAADGPAPPPRYGAAAAVVFGGELWATHGFTSSGRFDDTWSLSYLAPQAWSETTPDGPRPVERCLMRAVADAMGPHGPRLLMFGGQTNSTPFLGDLWALGPNGWTEITTEPKPSPRTFYSFVFDAPGRAILFGGNTEDGPLNDLWAFDAATDSWAQLAVEGDAPSPRAGHDAVWLWESRSFVVFGGNDGTSELSDLWVLGV